MNLGSLLSLLERSDVGGVQFDRELRVVAIMARAIAATLDGRILGLRVTVLADHGAFDACADPTQFPAGMSHICSGPYDIPAARQ